MINLWKNASEALSEGKNFTINVADNVLHNGRHYVEVRLEDNGPGIPETALSRLQQSETTPSNAARGMGLSIVGALAAKEGILITCRTQVGRGTLMSLLFPGAVPSNTQE